MEEIMMSSKIPVTIVSGFLGAGKTTLINKVLKEKHGEPILMVKEQNGIKVDRVLFETTGLADPAPIAQTFINVPFLNEHFILDAVLTVVDSKISYIKPLIKLNQQNKLVLQIKSLCLNIV